MLFKKASAGQKEKLLKAMLYPRGEAEGSTIYEISVNKTGTFAFQNIIDYMSGEEALGQLVMQSLQNSRLNTASQNVILQLIKENKGTHIIQRIMKTFSMYSLHLSLTVANCGSPSTPSCGTTASWWRWTAMVRWSSVCATT